MLRTTMAALTVSAMAATTVLTVGAVEAAPVTPRGVHTLARTPSSLTVDWTPLSGARAYRVQFSPRRTMSPARVVDVRASSAVLRGLEPLKRYYYRVSALDPSTGKRIGRYTPRIRTATTRKVSKPTGLRVVDTATTSASLAWNAPVGAPSYRVAASTSSDFSPLTSYTRSAGPRATVTGLRPDTTYYFRVQVVRRSGAGLTAFSLADSARTAPSLPDSFPDDGPVDVRVGSYNVMTVNSATEGNRRPWRERRAGVIRQILQEKVDVLGAQEVNQSYQYKNLLVDGDNQITDLKNGLNKAGGHYAVTNETPYNCANPASSYKCDYQYRGASGGDRIYYNTDTVDMVSQGSYQYPHQSTVKYSLAYAVFQVKRTGDRFFFASSHLDPKDKQVRIAQWYDLIAKVNELKGNLPVVTVGDFNTHKMDPIIQPMLKAMKSSGYGDVLNQAYAENPIRSPRAQRTVNGWINSANHLDHDVRHWSFPDNRAKAGITIDWIFASNSLPVKEYKLVLDYDPRTLQVQGVFPSDHNMIRATLTLP